MPLANFGIYSPTKGIKQDFPSILLEEAFMPNYPNDIENVVFDSGELQSAKLRVKEFSQMMDENILHMDQYYQKDGDSWLLLCTKKDVAYRDVNNDRLVYITPQYSTGVIRVENGSAKVYGGLNLDDCDDDPIAWADGSGGDVTPSRETSEIKENTASVKLVVAAGAGVELLAYHDLAAPVNLSTYDSIGFWFYSDVELASGDLQLILDDTAGCGSAIEQIDLPAITASTWTWVNLAMADPSLCTAIASIGLYQAVDKGAMTLYIDQIVAGDWAGQLGAGDFITIGTTYSSADTWYEVSSVDSDTEITLTAVYAGSTAYQQAYLARLTFSGTDIQFPESLTFNDKWIYNGGGADALQEWSGVNQLSEISGSPPKAKHLYMFENYLILGNLTSTSVEPYTYQWCSVGDETAWSTGNSGSDSIKDFYEVMGFEQIKGNLFIFTERSIEKLWLVDSDKVFDKERTKDGIGCYASRSIVNAGEEILFYSIDFTFRSFNGYTCRSISGNIEETVKNINPIYEKRIAGYYAEESNKVLFSVPTTESTGELNKLLVYDMNTEEDQDKWTFINIGVCTFAGYQEEEQLTWAGLTYTKWSLWPWTIWRTKAGRENAPKDLVSDYSGYVHNIFNSETDDGSAYTRSFVLGTDLSPEGSFLHLYKRLIKIYLLFRKESSGTIDLYTKKDFESSWALVEDGVSLTGDADIVRAEVNCDLFAKHFLFKLSSTDRFRFIGIEFIEFDVQGTR